MESSLSSMTDEIEINFRLDQYGRTIPCEAIVATTTPTTQDSENKEVESNQTAATISTLNVLDYTTKVYQTSFASHHKVMKSEAFDALRDELLFDCEVADCEVMPRTFWVPAAGFTPRFSLEQFALDVFTHHTSTLHKNDYDISQSGAEWWVQIRSPPEDEKHISMGNASQKLHDQSSNNGNDRSSKEKRPSNDLSESGISFHWDKDEDLRLLCGGSCYVHPHISTVTYLTEFGAPTLIVNCRVDNLTGVYIVSGKNNKNASEINDQNANNDKSMSVQEAHVSWPRTGKHLSFDGRFLHAAPPDLTNDYPFRQQRCIVLSHPSTSTTDPNSSAQQIERTKRQNRRVTFLVNIWLNYHPFNTLPFPEPMTDKMSGHNEQKMRLCFASESRPIESVTVPCQDDGTTTDEKNAGTTFQDCDSTHHDNESLYQLFVWPMGDFHSGETIRMVVPLSNMQSVANQGGTLHIKWQSSAGVRLLKNELDDCDVRKPVKRVKVD